ncbi:hypothetical protein Nepgr_009399 [Nepenthes gracilis]|uniref:Uncharacterized protein n=1 Tax=Nepenthes gracilis TaxID=150966 RepID=A0AAD3XKB0_NEPGR|nr:hypothetical protein Nepgr_009399 [Nepenthes gracilis]
MICGCAKELPFGLAETEVSLLAWVAKDHHIKQVRRNRTKISGSHVDDFAPKAVELNFARLAGKVQGQGEKVVVVMVAERLKGEVARNRLLRPLGAAPAMEFGAKLDRGMFADTELACPLLTGMEWTVKAKNWVQLRRLSLRRHNTGPCNGLGIKDAVEEDPT